MKVYFARHGETGFNTKKLFQNKDISLTEKGESQANLLADRFLKIPIDVILCSTCKRAEQTAEIINKKLNKEIVYSDYLAEKKWPDEIIGKEFRGPELLKFKEFFIKNLNDPDCHYSNEENFFDFRERVFLFFDFLDKRREEDILVVSHGGTIKMIICLMMLGKDFRPDIYFKAIEFFRIYNTGITLCEKNEENKWHLMTWNDHAHLG